MVMVCTLSRFGSSGSMDLNTSRLPRQQLGL